MQWLAFVVAESCYIVSVLIHFRPFALLFPARRRWAHGCWLVVEKTACHFQQNDVRVPVTCATVARREGESGLMIEE